jgi:hypothetical protein
LEAALENRGLRIPVLKHGDILLLPWSQVAYRVVVDWVRLLLAIAGQRLMLVREGLWAEEIIQGPNQLVEVLRATALPHEQSHFLWSMGVTGL